MFESVTWCVQKADWSNAFEPFERMTSSEFYKKENKKTVPCKVKWVKRDDILSYKERNYNSCKN